MITTGAIKAIFEFPPQTWEIGGKPPFCQQKSKSFFPQLLGFKMEYQKSSSLDQGLYKLSSLYHAPTELYGVVILGGGGASSSKMGFSVNKSKRAHISPSTKVQTKAFLSAPADKIRLVFFPQSKLNTRSVCSLSVWMSVHGSLSEDRVRIWISRELRERAMLLPSGLQAWHVIGSTPKLKVSVMMTAGCTKAQFRPKKLT